MIVYEASGSPLVRAGELDLCGRRVAARAVPYLSRTTAGGAEFDPIDCRFARRRPETPVVAGPARPEEWMRAFHRMPGGPVLVGPGDAGGEGVWGAFLAAAAGAVKAGRAVYLLDPTARAIPRPRGSELVSLLTWQPARGVDREALDASRSLGVPAGLLLPLLPGWTAEARSLGPLLECAAGLGASFVAPLFPEGDGGARRAIVEARAEVEPEAADEYFESVHHADWAAELVRGEALLQDFCARHGLAAVPPRPVGRGEPAANAAAASFLEKRARETADSEHRATMLHAAARWIDESGRDLSRIAREGNFRKVFPFEGELAREAEEALLRFGS